jgi:hypothetical protein
MADADRLKADKRGAWSRNSTPIRDLAGPDVTVAPENAVLYAA